MAAADRQGGAPVITLVELEPVDTPEARLRAAIEALVAAFAGELTWREREEVRTLALRAVSIYCDAAFAAQIHRPHEEEAGRF